jgi:hypothetical protein
MSYIYFVKAPRLKSSVMRVPSPDDIDQIHARS